MISHLSQLIKSAERFPEHLSYIRSPLLASTLTINTPIELFRSPRDYGLKSVNKIKPNSNIITLRTSGCVTSAYFTGSSPKENWRL